MRGIIRGRGGKPVTSRFTAKTKAKRFRYFIGVVAQIDPVVISVRCWLVHQIWVHERGPYVIITFGVVNEWVGRQSLWVDILPRVPSCIRP